MDKNKVNNKFKMNKKRNEIVEDKIEPCNNNNFIFDGLKNNNINKITDKDIFIKCQNTLEKANKMIGGEKLESLISNFKNINFINNDSKIKEDNTFQIDFRNDYSFKANDSNSNDINSYQTSKFCNSQIFNDEKEKNEDIKESKEEHNLINNNSIENVFINNSFRKEDSEIKNNIPSIQLPPTIQLLSPSDTLEENNRNKENNQNENNKDNSIRQIYDLNEEKLENYKEILTSLFEYLKLITQRNAFNDIISYGDIKYKYKMGFEQLIILIKSIPFNIIRAIQQSQYYNFVFRYLFIPYISRAFKNIKLFSLYHKRFTQFNQIIKNLSKKIIFRKLKKYIELTKKYNNSIDKKEVFKNSNIIKKENKNDNISIKEDNFTEPDISESKEMDSIEWDNDFNNIKKITYRGNSNIINNFTKIYNNEKSYSADYNLSIQEIVFEEQK